MLELVLVLIVCFVAIIFFLPFMMFCIKAIISLFRPHEQVLTVETQNGKEDPVDDSIKDSEADLAMTTNGEDSWLFPPELEDNE